MKLNKDISKLKLPQNLEIGVMVKKHREQLEENKISEDCYSFVLGQSPFPVPKPIKAALEKATGENDYVEAEGIESLREKVKEFNKRNYRLDIPLERILIGPGTKTILAMLFQMLEGHFILPTPAWVGYIPLLQVYCKSFEYLRMSAADDFKVTPNKLRDILKKTAEPSIFILNNPQNPTGALYSKTELIALSEVFSEYDVTVIADEIYALSTYQDGTFTSMASIYPKKTFVTNGISKDRSAGGYRLGTLILPEENKEKLFNMFSTYASSLYSNVSTPIQKACIIAYADNEEIKTYMNDTRNIHRMIGEYFSKYCDNIPGLSASKPKGGFYFTLDFNGVKDKLKKRGITTALELCHALFDNPYKVALITGDALGVDEEDFISRIAFVDYDGVAILKSYNKEKPIGREEEIKFISKHMAHMQKGFENIRQFIIDLDE
ncbi:MAG: pyridoxal phosphate-dependent aminotransferase [Bacillota bacterium]